MPDTLYMYSSVDPSAGRYSTYYMTFDLEQFEEVDGFSEEESLPDFRSQKESFIRQLRPHLHSLMEQKLQECGVDPVGKRVG